MLRLGYEYFNSMGIRSYQMSQKPIEELRAALNSADFENLEAYDVLEEALTELDNWRKGFNRNQVEWNMEDWMLDMKAKNERFQAKLEKAMRGLTVLVDEHKNRFCQPCNCSICKFVREEG